MIATKETIVKAAGQEFEWAFGCDGLLTLEEACDLLRVSRNTLDRLCAEKYLRKGKSPRHDPRNKATRVYICRRSLNEYLRSMEVGC
jgi:hypothetical protein